GQAGPEDTRTKAQRRHDALAEAMRRLAGSNLLPERGGSKPQVKVDMDLATLRTLPGSAQAEQQWLDHTTAQLARDRLNTGRTTTELLTDQTPAESPSEPAAPNSPHPPTTTTPSTPNSPMNAPTNAPVDTPTNRAATPTGGATNTPVDTPMNGADGTVNGAAVGVGGAVQPPLPGLGDGATLHGVG
ncbi:DUF222 domain-containing protein, partial [Actinomadura sp. HBU206391]|uniref:DUF222 domain-containing protein n=1 Tax=Actinomadura sp. HBU206391 TaxID=2731692 RepID=UPI00164FAF3A